MSKEAVRKFYEVLQSNKDLQDQVKAANSSGSVIDIAADKGYEFTELELEAVMQEAVAADGELSEEALEAVAGGGTKIKVKGDDNMVEQPAAQ